MYVKRVQITNYGPIEALDIEFPFDGDKPKPVILVGANGSGKSIFLSNIVNGLLSAQATAYPESPEVEPGKVYKLRSPQYVTSGKEYSFIQVDFADSPLVRELNLVRRKQDYGQIPAGMEGTDAQDLYEKLALEESSVFEHKIDQQTALRFLGKCCALYFPPNRFEDPAWLNYDSLTATAQYMNLKHLEGHSDRKIINYSPLHGNQNWLFEVIYDFSVFERQQVVLPIPVNISQTKIVNMPAPVSIDVPGSARNLYNSVTEVLRTTLCSEGKLSLSIGRRQNRIISVTINEKIRIPNIFQLSSGQVSLLNLFLSILRDYDLTGSQFNNTKEIRGIVIVDEIDLHLHTVYQHEALPKLMAMFPKIQFIVTSHSPLFVLGLKREFGEEGFGLYELPSGVQISTEEFKEFGEAYQAFSKTRQHSEELRNAIKNAQKPFVFVEGIIDVKYLQKAAMELGFQNLTEAVEIRDADGSGGLKNIWKGLIRDHVERNRIVVLYDPECERNDTKANMFRRSMTKFIDHPIQEGVENLFDHETLDKARREHPAFIDVTYKHNKEERGKRIVVPETWMVNKDEKTNLCNWLCENGTADDFEHFRPTLEMLKDLLVEDTTEDAS